MYSSLNPAVATEKSDTNFIQRFSWVETSGDGRFIPQNVPREFDVTEAPSFT
jgi:hypothetical protein